MNKSQFKGMLETMGFDKPASNFDELAKRVGGALLKVNFTNEKIYYPPQLTVNNQTVCNFSHGENFVVFECVHRLLAKGYKPEDIELEPRWQVGRGASGGRADILVRNGEDGTPLLLIECKTWGAEFDKERQKMLSDGGQLFSYLQQERSVRYLCLYASEHAADAAGARYRNAIVKIQDRAEDIAARQKGDETVKLYAEAASKRELFEVWKEIFNAYFHYNGIFEEDVSAYQIELKPLKGKDLLPLEDAGGIFNTFMEILRHNNISDNANAFNRILSLLLCKMVDENKGANEVLDFQVKEGEDTPERIQDRLQKLYSQGMKAYLGQDIVYFEDSTIENIVAQYPRQTPIERVVDIFRQIKYYTHNDFAFKEVHNKELFEQNARVLREIIRMLQNYRFRYTAKQQILGDFFELLLNHGVKQSEGQFFTPVPLVRFIISSVGLDSHVSERLRAGQPPFLPRILDYACGAGHFLTESIDDIQRALAALSPNVMDGEAARQLKRFQENSEWARDCIFGIEKDYRLARTSQIACFLNGDGDANIVYGDGLDDHAGIDSDTPFDVIVANPPYSVRKFKNYLRLKNNRYRLFDAMSEDGREIETLFLERAAQVLKPGGRAGIIFPDSILTGGGMYEKTREILLAAFQIVAIARMGRNTFSATGTETVVLFLRRRDDSFAADRRYIAEDLFGGATRQRHLEHIDSQELLQKYAAHRGVALADYQSFMAKDANVAMQKTALWRDCRKFFEELPDNQKQRTDFYRWALAREQEKFYIFLLALDDAHRPQNVVIVGAGQDKTVEEAFLGYKFSTRRGSQGIKILLDAEGAPATKMYDARDADNPRKAAAYIRRNFAGVAITDVAAEVREHIGQALLTTMIDFTHPNFIKAINPVASAVAPINSKWDMVKLESVAAIRKGTAITKAEATNGNVKVVAGGMDYAYTHGESNRTPHIVTIGGSGKAGFVNYWSEAIFASDCITIQCDSQMETRYLYHALKFMQAQIYALARGNVQKHVYSEDLKIMDIPYPPLQIRQAIVDECAQAAAAGEDARRAIAAAKRQMQEAMLSLAGAPARKLGDVADVIENGSRPKGGAGGIVDGAWSLGGEHIHSETGRVDLSSPRYVPMDFYRNAASGKVRAGDILLCKDGAPGKVALLRDELAQKDAMVNEHVYLLRCECPDTQLWLFYFLFSPEGQKRLKAKITGAVILGLNSGNLKEIAVPMPPVAEIKRVVKQLQQHEDAMAAARAVIARVPARQNDIVAKHILP